MNFNFYQSYFQHVVTKSKLAALPVTKERMWLRNISMDITIPKVEQLVADNTIKALMAKELSGIMKVNGGLEKLKIWVAIGDGQPSKHLKNVLMIQHIPGDFGMIA